MLVLFLFYFFCRTFFTIPPRAPAHLHWPDRAPAPSHHELPSPAPVRQQLRGQPPQRLHDGSTEADPAGILHLIPGLPGHGATTAPEHPDPDPDPGSGLGRQHGQFPQLLLQRGEERPDGAECRGRRTC